MRKYHLILITFFSGVLLIGLTVMADEPPIQVKDSDLMQIIESDLSDSKFIQILNKKAGSVSSLVNWVTLGQVFKSLKDRNVMIPATRRTEKNADAVDPSLSTSSYEFTFGAPTPFTDSKGIKGSQITFSGRVVKFYYFSHVCSYPEFILTGRVTQLEGNSQISYELESSTFLPGHFSPCL